MEEQAENLKTEEMKDADLQNMEQMDELRLGNVMAARTLAITDTPAWKEIRDQENLIGPEALLETLLDKKVLSEVEMLWMVRNMMSYYGKEDALLKKAPVRRLLMNTNELLRIIFLLLDRPQGELEINMCSYLSAKLQQATWGINQNTRRYLEKIDGRDVKTASGHPPVFFV